MHKVHGSPQGMPSGPSHLPARVVVGASRERTAPHEVIRLVVERAVAPNHPNRHQTLALSTRTRKRKATRGCSSVRVGGGGSDIDHCMVTIDTS
jgi:hypothetical protein